MQFNNKKKMSALMLSTTLLLTACGGESAGGDKTGDAPKPAIPTITWLNLLHTASTPTGPVQDKLEQLVGANIEFSWVPAASADERISVALASNTLTDVVGLGLSNSAVRSALKSGLFWDVGPYLDEFDNLKKITSDLRRSASIEGKLYGVPTQIDVARNGVMIRKDWLDKLGLPVPKTTQELFEVAKAFTERDPDGNGVKDTTGFVDRSDLIFGVFKTLSSYFGTPNNWAVNKEGKMTAEFETDAYIQTMDYMKKLYDNGYINKDFAVTSKEVQQQSFAQGKAGIYIGALTDSKNLLSKAKGIQDKMELALVNNITSTGKDSDRAIWAINNGVGSILALPKTEVKDEKELKQVLKVIDKMMNEDVYTLMTYGIKDVHYNVDASGGVTILDNNLWQQEVQPFGASRPKISGFSIHDANPLSKQFVKLMEENTKYAVMNPAYPLESSTNTSQGSELQKIITDATYKYIMGKMDLEGFKKAVEQWKKAGGSTITSEYEAAYKVAEKNASK